MPRDAALHNTISPTKARKCSGGLYAVQEAVPEVGTTSGIAYTNAIMVTSKESGAV